MVTANLIYEERLTSDRTEALFLALMLLFGGLFVGRKKAARAGRLAGILPLLSAMFLFYAINFRMLVIRLSPQALALTFGIFTWTVPVGNIQSCDRDQIPLLMRLGGAGIHFMSIGGRYRASFNFLEYPRVVVRFKEPLGPVKDISFSTRRADEIIRLIREIISEPVTS